MARPECIIEECQARNVARGLCRKHYSRWRKHGDPLITKRLYRAPVGDRLRSKLIEAPYGCWNFTGWRDARGYGKFKVAGKIRSPHRVAFEEWVGPIPFGMMVCHHCDNPSCCNPEHLFLGTQQDNMDDMNAKGRGNVDSMIRAAKLTNGRVLRERAARLRAEAAMSAGFPADHKCCASCGHFQPPSNFGPNKGRADGLQTYCRPCAERHRKGVQNGEQDLD